MITLSILGILLYSFYGGIVWRLRGGAISHFLEVGTTKTRLITMTMLILPVVLYELNYIYLALIPIFWLSLVLAGWGPYMSMSSTNRIGGITPRESWIDFFPKMLGCTSSWWFNFWGMIVCGVLQMPYLLFLAYMKMNIIPLLFIPFMILAFPIIYDLVHRIPMNSTSRFPSWLVTHFPNEHIDYGEVIWGSLIALTIGISIVFL
jgi:hypothetical protein